MRSYLKTCIQSWASFPSQMMAEMQSIASCWDRQWVTGPEQCLTKSSPIHSKNFNASEPYFSINLKKSVNLLYSSSSILALTAITATNRRITIDAIAKKEYKKLCPKLTNQQNLHFMLSLILLSVCLFVAVWLC